ncbi:MAG: DJ-1 family protein [Zetaproteobacteria bacterium CG_4_9_14_3_um_filter_49_83]|nr:MAG: DJ-1 family protein [Zetaproteobacteria bacterium CG1_02_49_23]PIQ33064.1 MAG: DJ-1 family protein [Zetaproteobacteria bacterium CG17_big_fil_post_rev_8_21_14_2_50_50_13]PIV31372.1 MAG: DJ-1 family protein [Zetaproteobacteria bacterium CG02_land_8_20_14_3_00_50_9]PIY56339.1 MAG: DJ-1 family protein [Zetaproteobacteria bacterium CG_4_10_14_0_8_um_filter_49_80]PJA35764.1 MAG: DJ-1 family protein [Zetaproteobacteria bacterium CG_4_9_14_3_um_filter_49_83]
MSRVLVPFTRGVEEIECIAVVDILRRADIEVCMASLDGAPVVGRSAITILPDAALPDIMHEAWDMVVLPGGLPNAHLLRDDANVKAVVDRLRSERKSIAAICAAPTALAAFGITAGKKVTSYPSCQQEMQSLQPSSVYSDDAVVEDDFLTTSRGAGTSLLFALRLVARLCGEEKAEQIGQSIVMS